MFYDGVLLCDVWSNNLHDCWNLCPSKCKIVIEILSLNQKYLISHDLLHFSFNMDLENDVAVEVEDQEIGGTQRGLEII